MSKANGFVHNISATTLQLIVSNGTGFIIFYVLSKQLDKATFGNFNWALAILLASFGILSFGIDQLVVKKIASGEKVSDTLSSYVFHVLLTGIFFYMVVLLSSFLFPSFHHQLYLLVFLAAGKLFAFFSMPFKQLCAGLERFRLLFFMCITSNVIKVTSLFTLSVMNVLSIQKVLVIFIIGDFTELVIAVLIVRRYIDIPFRIKVDFNRYKLLLKEALPQLGTVIFASCMARLDWILIGIFSTSSKLADYSFAYKVFELCTLPLFVIGPLLVPWFARIFKSEDVAASTLSKLKLLLSAELIIASLTSLVLAILWVPVIDFITDGKYGHMNRNTVLILSLCIPFLYFNNFLWTVNFSLARLKLIFGVFAATFSINLVADIVLIPLVGNEGAAIAYLLALFCQSVCFVRTTKIAGLDKTLYPLFICSAGAIASGFTASYFFNNTMVILITSVCTYLIIVITSLRLPVLTYSRLRSAIEIY